MKKLLLVTCCMAICMWMAGCKIGELTPEEKQKVSQLRQEISQLEANIAATEKEIVPGSSGLIPSLKQSRLEVDMLTVSLLRQHVAAMESRAKITVSIPATTVDLGISVNIENEMKQVEEEILKGKAESSLYSGGLIKAAILARIATHELTLASMKQKLLTNKYGLALPSISSPASTSSNLAASNSGTSNPPPSGDPHGTKHEPEIVDPGPFDIRKARWGMSKEDVIKRESLTGTEMEGTLVYTDSVAGKKASLLYLFDNDRLWRVAYSLSEEYMNKNNYVDDYETIVSALKEKYGKPRSENTYWSRNLFKGDYPRRGMAYSIGDVTSIAIWDHENTEIVARISGENSDISVIISYSSKELEKEYRKKAKEKESSNL